jgi:membrane protease YdiL (CAAX protease family)
VPWTGRDLAITLLAGGGLGLFLTVLFLLPLQNAGTQLRPAAVLLITSLLVYGPLCLLGWYFALKRNGASPADAGLRWVGWGPVLLMIPGAIGLIIVTGLLSALIGQLLGNVPTAQEQVIPGQTSLPTWDLVALVVAGAIAAPFAEEFLFRGLLYRYLRSRRSVQAAVLISSLIFAIAHFTPILIPVLFVFGIAEALVAERYESLYPAMALHALNNGALFVALYLTLN